MDPVFKFVTVAVYHVWRDFLCWYLTVIEPCNFFDTCSIVRFFLGYRPMKNVLQSDLSFFISENHQKKRDFLKNTLGHTLQKSIFET